ncbi:hypothetical protein F383_35781 [Gossypium arboreum]|uniref:Uncharacterized protein n=1 Tax=Gossypium arboreum TaxID=29729 RepID=A0A0B0PVT2_GOSAR|nr:hypothetical protein F383_35781 [Gossypium arboreum]
MRIWDWRRSYIEPPFSSVHAPSPTPPHTAVGIRKASLFAANLEGESLGFPSSIHDYALMGG